MTNASSLPTPDDRAVDMTDAPDEWAFFPAQGSRIGRRGRLKLVKPRGRRDVAPAAVPAASEDPSHAPAAGRRAEAPEAPPVEASEAPPAEAPEALQGSTATAAPEAEPPQTEASIVAPVRPVPVAPVAPRRPGVEVSVPGPLEDVEGIGEDVPDPHDDEPSSVVAEASGTPELAITTVEDAPSDVHPEPEPPKVAESTAQHSGGKSAAAKSAPAKRKPASRAPAKRAPAKRAPAKRKAAGTSKRSAPATSAVSNGETDPPTATRTRGRRPVATTGLATELLRASREPTTDDARPDDEATPATRGSTAKRVLLALLAVVLAVLAAGTWTMYLRDETPSAPEPSRSASVDPLAAYAQGDGGVSAGSELGFDAVFPEKPSRDDIELPGPDEATPVTYETLTVRSGGVRFEAGRIVYPGSLDVSDASTVLRKAADASAAARGGKVESYGERTVDGDPAAASIASTADGSILQTQAILHDQTLYLVRVESSERTRAFDRFAGEFEIL